MSPEERWQKIEGIFLAAVEISDQAARSRFLDEVCAGDEQLRSEVEKLIRQDERAQTFLSRPLVEESGIYAFADLIDGDEDDPLVGKKVGKYEILREIGAGGMGVVYLAQRADGSFQKQVALKIVKRGMDTKFILRRFRQERQVLALLNHPFIAALLDGGTTEDGLPYFVMDFIEGEPLYRYADKEKLTVAERLGIFVKICSAVEYAHQNQVIHRDLKPSNILIKTDGTPRLLDFGIAKVFNPEFQGDITVDPTLTAMRMMTPEYASPEQAKGETVTAASDIYSLGVLLYELLTGHRPYRFKNRAAFEIARVICEEDPARPSWEITKNENFVPTGASRTPEEIYQSRGSRSLEHLKRQLEGDLENIVLKALRKNPAERYESTAALAADITNYLENRPVTAESFITVAADDLERTTAPHLADAAQQTNHDSASAVFAAETPTAAAAATRRVLTRAKIWLVAAIALVPLGYLVYNVATRQTTNQSSSAPTAGSWKNSFSSTMNVKRLTTAGKALSVAISPDGKQVAYVAEENGGQILLVHPTDGGEEWRIARAENNSFKAVTFSPDGADVYYILAESGGAHALYRIAAAGGDAQKVSDRVSEAVGFAPDGKRVAYFGYDAKERVRTLYVAELDGSKQLQPPVEIASRRLPLYFGGTPAFSPDGKKIAVVSSGASQESRAEITVFDLATRGEENLKTQPFLAVSSIAWRANGAEIVFIADKPRSDVSQIWLAEYPSGETYKLTNDLNNYSGVSLAREADSLVTIKSETTRNIWLTNLSEQAGVSGGGFTAKQITDGSSRQDGLKGVSWSRADKILFIAGGAEENILTETDADGGGARVINLGGAQPISPLLTSDDRFLIYADERFDDWTLWRRDRENGETRRIAQVNAIAPTLTPDNRFVIYSASSGTNERISLRRVSIEGGDEIELTSDFCVRPAVSPDNLFIACYYNGAATGNRWEIAVLNAAGGGVPVRVIKTPDTLNLQTPFERPLAWSPDSRSIFYLNDAGGATNIFRVSADGSGGGKPAPVTHFTSGRIFDFSLSPDGKRAVLSRGSTASDAVIFKSGR